MVKIPIFKYFMLRNSDSFPARYRKSCEMISVTSLKNSDKDIFFCLLNIIRNRLKLCSTVSEITPFKLLAETDDSILLYNKN